ncbi:MAG: hypothetical protein WDN44_16270 [Sphingomonas sp.]
MIRRPDGEPFGVLAVTLDITERRAAEAALRNSEESLRLAVESAGMATWELDLETLDGGWSPNRFDLLGLPRTPDLRGSVDDWLQRIDPRGPRQRARQRLPLLREGRALHDRLSHPPRRHRRGALAAKLWHADRL